PLTLPGCRGPNLGLSKWRVVQPSLSADLTDPLHTTHQIVNERMTMPTTPAPYLPLSTRYDAMDYRRIGRSGLKLPRISLGLWNNFGDDYPLENQRAILRRAFDIGITHFDLANNYGPPAGSAETNFGALFAQDFRPYRDELLISTKAGFDMWPGPYGEWGS